MAAPVDFELNAGEHIAITGPNGGGKTMFVNLLTGAHPMQQGWPAYDFGEGAGELVSDNIKYIAFRDSYGESDQTYYLQQRWNQQEIGEETPTVAQILHDAYALSGEDTPERRGWQRHLYDAFGMEQMLDKYIILLSSGELRKLQLTKALLCNPKVLIIDNPFIGLDAEARLQLMSLLGTIASEGATQLLLVLPRFADIPSFVTHVVEVRDMLVGKKMPREEYVASRQPTAADECGSVCQAIAALPPHADAPTSGEVVGMNGVYIRYGGRTILDSLHWHVMNGERWAVTGRNGSGKSTLLSLVCADNPQAYACDITLFGRRRGSGESIWEIKRHIGYVSPEMHRAYRKNIPAIDIVASGLKETVGLYAKPNAGERELCAWWMGLFGLAGMEERPFLKLSSGEQRLVLLARAFVKDPELLILDEPLHGLDDDNSLRVKAMIEAFCQRSGKTLIMISHYKEELPACINHTLTLTSHNQQPMQP